MRDDNADTIAAAEVLLKSLKAAKHFGDTKDAVLAFIESADTDTGVLGDGDLCGLAADALERRGKPLDYLPMLAAANRKSSMANRLQVLYDAGLIVRE
jgi:hypothetical protein